METGITFESDDTTPAKDNSFRVGDNRLMLDEKKKDLFHTTTTQASFLCERARPDAQPTTAVSCARVKSPGQKDWNEPVQMMKFLHATADNALTLDTGNGVHNMEWSVDSAFGVHPDFKSHVGGNVCFQRRKRITD